MPGAPRTVAITFPIYCLGDRASSKLLSQAMLVGTTFLVDKLARRALLAYRHRGTAAAQLDRERHLKPWPIFSPAGLDRLAVVAVGRLQCRWLALEPDAPAKTAEAFVDLVAWLRGRQPWPAALTEFGRTSGIGTPEALLAVVSA